jgi:hypothetical protein
MHLYLPRLLLGARSIGPPYVEVGVARALKKRSPSARNARAGRRAGLGRRFVVSCRRCSSSASADTPPGTIARTVTDHLPTASVPRPPAGVFGCREGPQEPAPPASGLAGDRPSKHRLVRYTRRGRRSAGAWLCRGLHPLQPASGGSPTLSRTGSPEKRAGGPKDRPQ